MKKIIAVFIGQDGSCGYTHGERYTLDLISYKDNSLSIECDNVMASFCEYQSIFAFLNNWKEVSLHV
jgi:hypothetical protein